MPQYIIVNGATGETVESNWISLLTDSSERIKIVRIRVCPVGAGDTAAVRVRIYRCSAIGSGINVTNPTPIKKDPLAPASVTALSAKNGGGDWASSGNTVIDTIDDISFVGRSMYQWEAIDEDDCIWIEGGDYFVLTILGQTTDYRATVEWQED